MTGRRLLLSVQPNEKTTYARLFGNTVFQGKLAPMHASEIVNQALGRAIFGAFFQAADQALVNALAQLLA